MTEAVKEALSEESGLLRGEQLAKKIREENSIRRMTEEYKRVYRKLVEEKERN